MPAPASNSADSMRLPYIWRYSLLALGIGKAAVAGAGLAIAFMGALDIAFAVTARDFMDHLRPHYFDWAALGGGVLASLAAIVREIILTR